MPSQIDLDEILARNPGVNREQLEEATKLFQELREQGVGRKGYDLAPPAGGHRAVVRDDARTDSRVVRLTRPQEP